MRRAAIAEPVWCSTSARPKMRFDCLAFLGRIKTKIVLNFPRPLSRCSDKYKQKAFRILTYKTLQNYKQVQFAFLDSKLVAIIMEAPNAEIEKDWIDPDDLEDLFAVVFKPHKRQYGHEYQHHQSLIRMRRPSSKSRLQLTGTT